MKAYWLAAFLILSVSTSVSAQNDFIRGDCHGDGRLDIADAQRILDFQFCPCPPLPCFEACDTDNDGTFNGILDTFYLLNSIFMPGAPPIAAPHPDCGADPDPANTMGCQNYDCTPAPLPPPDPDYVLKMTGTHGSSGGTVDIPVRLDILDDDGEVDSITWGVCHPPAMEVLEVALADDLTTINDDFGPHFFLTSLSSEGYVVALITNFTGQESFEMGQDHHLVTATYALNEEGLFEVEFCPSLTDPPQPPRAVCALGVLNVVTPVTQNALVQASGPFRRGDANADGVFHGLIDGLFILQFQFIPGSPPLPCVDAADADDDGGLNGILDGLYVLNYQFVAGSPAPPPPGPDECGPDPGGDSASCDAYDACP